MTGYSREALQPARRGGKLLLSFGFILTSLVYVLWQRSANLTAPDNTYQTANQQLIQTLAQIAGTSSPATPTAETATQPSAPTAQPAPSSPSSSMGMGSGMGMTGTGSSMMQGPYTNGSYTGSAVDAYYGTVQVEAVIKNGYIADVQFLQHPDTHRNSVFINDQAMPLLTQEAIQAQSAQVSGVSGATFTSEAFKQSLASALTQAKG